MTGRLRARVRMRWLERATRVSLVLVTVTMPVSAHAQRDGAGTASSLAELPSEPLGLVWENYELQSDVRGDVTYQVSLTLERTFESGFKGMVARVTGNLQNLVARDGSGTGKVSVQFDQTRPGGPVVVDHLTINLADNIPGPYRLTLSIRDIISGRVASRTTDFHLTR
jgi:hypothetical protein